MLVYSGSTGYRHESIPAAVEALKSIGTKAGYVVDTSEDPEVFTAEKLEGLQGHRAREHHHRSEEAGIRVVRRARSAMRCRVSSRPARASSACTPPVIRTTTGAGTAR